MIGPSVRHLVETLADDLQRLAQFLHADQIAIVDIAVGAERHFEIEPVVDQVGLCLADVIVDPATAQARAGESVVESPPRAR